MKLEIVSHCWNYSRLLTYQLSSIVLYPPTKLDVTFTVYYTDEDERTAEVLRYFGEKDVPNVAWNWRNVTPGELFQRPMGRNEAALATKADWIWFCDCDQVFHAGCLDALPAELAACRNDLVFPKYAMRTQHIDADNPIFTQLGETPQVIDINPADFTPTPHTKAVGGMQIVRGDVARRVGYCRDMPKYQKPLKRFPKQRADVVFRRAVLGEDGAPINVPAFYRIEHVAKGRKRLQSARL